MRKKKCMREHYPESICMVEKIVFFHKTKFRISLCVHEYYCPVCKKARDFWFIGLSFSGGTEYGKNKNRLVR